MNLTDKWQIFIFAVLFCILLYELICRTLNRLKVKRAYTHFSKHIILDAFNDMKAAKEDFGKFHKKQQLLIRTRTAPIIGWTMLPNVNNGVVWTDENGFRNNNTDISGKTVIAVFGGSVAQGSKASDNNHTLTGRLEHYLQKEYGDDIVVLNMAQSAFTMLQEVSLFCLLVDKLNIKVSVFIDGENDVSSAFKNLPRFFGFAGTFFGGWTKSARGVIKVDTFPKTLLRFLCEFLYSVRNTRKFLESLLKKKPIIKESDKNKEEAYRAIIESFSGVEKIVRGRLHGSDRFALMTLQPVLFDYKRPSPAEKEFIAHFSEDTISYWRKSYKNLKEKLYNRWHSYYIANKVSDNVILADFTGMADNVKSTVFADECHFGDFGNDLYARDIFRIIKYQGWLASKKDPITSGQK